MDILKKNSRILVVGLGKRSGLSVCNFLSRKGHSVVVTDKKTEEKLKDVIAELYSEVNLIAGDQSPDLLKKEFDLVVISPGVPKRIPLIMAAYEKGIPVIAEVELAFKYIKGHIIAITGTDGKSTTTSLVGHILKGLNIKTFIGGNIGIPLISFAQETDEDSVSVVELSSFQLETIEKFRPDVAAILNVNPDHLDRYSDMDDYFKAKQRITMNQMYDDCYIYNADDKIITGGLDKISSKKLSFSISKKNVDAIYENDSIYILKENKAEKIVDVSRMRIFGRHNIENTMAALLMVFSILKKMNINADHKKIKDCCYSFKGLVHRMERIGIIKGRSFINDSKATTVGAVEMALRSMSNGTILIMGGRTKGDDYSRLVPIMKEKLKHLILIGESTGDFKQLYKDISNEIAGTMDDAVQKAMKKSIEGDVIILSPACASFDMFTSFEDRGEKFKESVFKLDKGEISWT